jgi:hypothetical protein
MITGIGIPNSQSRMPRPMINSSESCLIAGQLHNKKDATEVPSAEPGRLPQALGRELEGFGRNLSRFSSVFHSNSAIANGGEAMATAKQQSKVKNVMHEHKHGTLKSGSGRKVKSRKQAIAIAMSESGQSRSRKKAG